MQITINKKSLLAALKKLKKASAPKGSNPALGCVKFETQKHGVALTTCDSDVWLELVLPCKVIEQGTCLIPLVSLAKKAKVFSDMLTIGVSSSSDKVVEIRDGGKRSVAIQLPVKAQFPEWLKTEKEVSELMPSSVWERVCTECLPIAPADYSKPWLRTVHVERSGEQLVGVATDSRRLTHITVKDLEKAESWTADIKRNGLDILSSLLNIQDINLAVSRGAFKSYSTITFTGLTKLMGKEKVNYRVSEILHSPDDTPFPPYKEVIPKTFSGKCKVNCHEFSSAIKWLLEVRDDRDNGIVIKTKYINGSELRGLDFSDPIVEAQYEIPAQETQGNMDVLIPEGIGVNPEYLRDVLRALDDDAEITVGFSGDKLDPLVLETDGHISVIMPMRI